MPIYDNPNDPTNGVTLQPWMTGGGVRTTDKNNGSGRYGNGGWLDVVNNNNLSPARNAPTYTPNKNGTPSTFDFAWAGATPGAGNKPGDAAAFVSKYAPKNYTVARQNPGGVTNYGSGDYSKYTDYTSLMNGLNAMNPGDINIDAVSGMFTNAALSQYGQNSADQLKYLKQAGMAGVNGYQGVLDTLKGGVSDYLQNINKGAEAENQGINGTLNYYQTLANRNQLPGQGLMEQNIQGNTANALNQVRQYGGSSQGALGAITSLYNNQNQSMRDIGLSAAQYQAQNQQNLGQYMGTVGAQRAGVYNRVGEAQLGGSQILSQGQQLLTQAKQSQMGDISNYYGNQAQQSPALLQQLMQQRLNAEQQQADLARRSILDVGQTVGSGLEAQTNASNYNYNMNQVMPYQNYANFFNAMMGNQVNPNGAASIAGQMYQQNNLNWQQTQAGWANALNNVGGLVGNVAGQYMMQPGNWQSGGGSGASSQGNSYNGANYNGVNYGN